ncbi:MAG: hypothetical protein M0P57_05760 [Syntrophales bacterium]|nr:hypothetical protein [Syntrophales bacterium]MDY0045048.1 hypothetical protein [Syntrophales bacterium]
MTTGIIGKYLLRIRLLLIHKFVDHVAEEYRLFQVVEVRGVGQYGHFGPGEQIAVCFHRNRRSLVMFSADQQHGALELFYLHRCSFLRLCPTMAAVFFLQPSSYGDSKMGIERIAKKYKRLKP